MKIFTKNRLITALSSTLLAASYSNLASATEFTLANGWEGDVGFQIQAFLTDIDNNVTGESSSRIQSGFDPSKFTMNLRAPEHNGLKVSGTFQAVQSIQGAKNQGDGSTNNFGVRIAQVSVEGSFGTIKLGRDIAIFGLSSLAHDTGSLPGVGRGGTVDGGGATAGRINYGYYYPDFHAGIQYSSHSINGVSFHLGLFDPIAVADDSSTPMVDESVRAEDLRLEGGINYKSKDLDLWVSFIDQNTLGAAEISGFDLGGELRLGPVGLTAAFSDGTGINCCTPSTDEFEQWYFEADYKLGKTTIGGSYGENELSNAAGALISEGELTLLFVHHDVTPTLTFIAEWNNETVSPAGGGADTTDRDTLAFGVNWQF